jgi:hypothetical protein
MIDSRVTIKFLSQVKIKKLHLNSSFKIRSEYKTLDDISFRTYDEYTLRIDVVNTLRKKSSIMQRFLDADLEEIDMILELI